MLKWTVTKRSEANGRTVLPQSKALLQQRHHDRRSLGALSERMVAAPNDGTANGALRMKKVRRSLGAAVHNDCANYDKENQCITSTPHPASGRAVGSPYTMALRDVSNITPNTTPCRPSNVATPQSRKRTLAASPVSTGLSIRETYATTLPTFDIEYSPCGVKNVPYLALRGLGLADFDKPGRYFAADEEGPIPKRVKTSKKPLHNDDIRLPSNEDKINPCLTPLSSRLSDLCFNKINFKRPLSVGKTMTLLAPPPPPPPPPPPSSSSTETIEENELSLNSSEMGDLTLDKMIDAILESAKKDNRWATPRPKRSSSVKSKQSKGSSPTYTPADDPAADLYLGHQFPPASLLRQDRETTIILEETSHINEREVKTPDVKRDQLAKAKGGYVRQSLSKLMMAASPLEAACHLRRQKAVRRKHKLETGGQGLRAELQRTDVTVLREDSPPASPDTPCVPYNESKMSEINVLATPVRDERLVQELGNLPQQPLSANATPNIRSIDLQGTSTPTGESIGKSRKCLTFSPTLSEDSIEKRRSVASSTNSRMSTLVASTSGTAVRGTLELSICLEPDRRLQVHVIRCKDLQRTTPAGSTAGCSAINAYVKLALINLGDSQAKQKDSGFQRTTVHRNSHGPYYDQRFHFEVYPDDERRIQLAVWHRDRECKSALRRSEFLGCMSFPVKNVTKQGINGAYRLQPQSCLTNPTTPILETMGENSQSSMEELMNAEDSNSARATNTVTSTTASLTAGTNTVADGTVDAGGEQISLSKKAIHQRDADENLFLRFLELDPSPEAPPATSGGVNQPTPATPRRSSVGAGGSLKPTTGTGSSGRTPFTITKRLARTGDRGFGFSIVWTHPPRVEKVETGLSADRAGILPGDYVVFVDKHNVVTMPEQDVLNLIRTQGNTLLLEIFRRPLSADGPQLQSRTNGLRNLSSVQTAVPSQGSMGSTAAHIAPFNTSNGIALPLTDEGEPLIRTSPSPFGVARSSTACSNISIETAKRKLHLPQVTFSKEVGKGVLV
uniref:PDZ domain-containing protein n=1 Tax=Anopheles dirus TaxID=7168 RepID=A0A182NN71_9DIPT